MARKNEKVYHRRHFLCLRYFSQAQEPKARMVDGFGRLPCGHMMAVLDSLLSEWTANTEEQIVVVYTSQRFRKTTRYGNKGKPDTTLLAYPHPDDGLNWAKGISRYLIDRLTFGNLPGSENHKKAAKLRDGIALISGRYGEEVRAEIWLVPPSVADPIPTPVLRESDVRFGAKKPYPIPAYYFCYTEH